MSEELETDVIPGFTAAQSWAMNVIAEKAASKAVAAANLGPCVRDCSNVVSLKEENTGLKRTLYGEDGRSGLVASFTRLETRTKTLITAVSLLSVGVIGLAADLIKTLWH